MLPHRANLVNDNVLYHAQLRVTLPIDECEVSVPQNCQVVATVIRDVLCQSNHKQSVRWPQRA
jgi:hypothetical protein